MGKAKFNHVFDMLSGLLSAPRSPRSHVRMSKCPRCQSSAPRCWSRAAERSTRSSANPDSQQTRRHFDLKCQTNPSEIPVLSHGWESQEVKKTTRCLAYGGAKPCDTKPANSSISINNVQLCNGLNCITRRLLRPRRLSLPYRRKAWNKGLRSLSIRAADVCLLLMLANIQKVIKHTIPKQVYIYTNSRSESHFNMFEFGKLFDVFFGFDLFNFRFAFHLNRPPTPFFPSPPLTSPSATALFFYSAAPVPLSISSCCLKGFLSLVLFFSFYFDIPTEFHFGFSALTGIKIPRSLIGCLPTIFSRVCRKRNPGSRLLFSRLKPSNSRRPLMMLKMCLKKHQIFYSHD